VLRVEGCRGRVCRVTQGRLPSDLMRWREMRWLGLRCCRGSGWASASCGDAHAVLAHVRTRAQARDARDLGAAAYSATESETSWSTAGQGRGARARARVPARARWARAGGKSRCSQGVAGRSKLHNWARARWAVRAGSTRLPRAFHVPSTRPPWAVHVHAQSAQEGHRQTGRQEGSARARRLCQRLCRSSKVLV
jgi:hypothetical protein